MRAPGLLQASNDRDWKALNVGPAHGTPGASTAGRLTQALGDLSFPHAVAFAGEDGGVRGLEAVHAAVTYAGTPAEIRSLHFSMQHVRRLTAHDSCFQKTTGLNVQGLCPAATLT